MEITVDPMWIVVAILVVISLLLLKRVSDLNKKLKRLNVPVLESKIAQSVYQITQATEQLNAAMIQSQNIHDETDAYYQRIKYILDHSGWTAVRLQNLSNAIREVGEGTNDTHITLEIEADNPNLNAPGESKKSESAGAQEINDQTPNQMIDEDISTLRRWEKLILIMVGFGFGMTFYHLVLR
jgi:uncharacterized phage infection (PIP) family protein YhgE